MTGETTYIALVAALVLSLVLLGSSIGHFTRRDFVSALRKHGVFPLRMTATVARVVAATELVVATAIGFGIAWLPHSESPLRAAGTTATALFIGYFLYQWRILAVAPGTPCGCSGSAVPVSGWTLFRAGVLLLASLSMTLLDVSAAVMSDHVFLIGLSSLGLSTIIWFLPEATTSQPRISTDKVFSSGLEEWV
jgi:hypothetical protein